MRSSFFGFATAQRAMGMNQKALDIVGQNIANMGTKGYTRQRLDLVSMAPVGYGDKYSSMTSMGIGQGVKMSGIGQMRDPYLDLRFRREAPKIGEIDAKSTALEDLESVFDETMMDGMNSQISDFIKQLQALSGKAGNAEFDGITKASAEVLTKLFNQYSKQVGAVREEQSINLDKIAIARVNDILSGISELNKSIKKGEINGSNSLELQDQRNLLIDELSTYVKIDVKTTPIEISPGIVVNHITIDMPTNGTPPTRTLVDGDKYAKFSSTIDPATGKTDISHEYPSGVGTPTVVTDEITTGSFKGFLDMLNKSGEFDVPASSVRGVGYYEKMLDTLAVEMAKQLNHLNSIEKTPPVTPPTYDPADYDEWKPLFESSDGKPLSATNITIAAGWKNNDYSITCTKITDPGDNSAANENVEKMIAMFSKKLDFTTNGGATSLFKGTFQECLSQVGNVLALEINSNTKVLKNYLTVVNGIDSMRDGISGVSLDEEGINLLKYQKSYNAAARLMTTLDEALDTIINRMGVVGR